MIAERWQRIAVWIVGIAAAVIVVLVVVTLADGGHEGFVVEDAEGDCREPGRDFGDQCDAGADVRSLTLWVDGPSLIMTVVLDAVPPLDPAVAWRVQLNVATANGKVCGLSNVVDDVATESVDDYGFDPAFGLDPLTRRPLEEGLCRASLDGATVRFVVDVSGEDAAATFRVVGFTLLEFADDDGRGSQDDFGFRGTLAELG